LAHFIELNFTYIQLIFFKSFSSSWR